MIRIFSFLFILVCAAPAMAQSYIVKEVIDGDTIVVSDGVQLMEVDLLGVETPVIMTKERNLMTDKPLAAEIRQAKVWGVDIADLPDLGREAVQYLDRMDLLGREVSIELADAEKKREGKILAYVYFDYCNGAYDCLSPADYVFPFLYQKFSFNKDTARYVFINATLVNAGYAIPRTEKSNDPLADLFMQLNEEAKKMKKGLWKR